MKEKAHLKEGVCAPWRSVGFDHRWESVETPEQAAIHRGILDAVADLERSRNSNPVIRGFDPEE